MSRHPFFLLLFRYLPDPVSYPIQFHVDDHRMRDDPFSSGSFLGNILHTTLNVTERCADRWTCVFTLISTLDTPSEV